MKDPSSSTLPPQSSLTYPRGVGGFPHRLRLAIGEQPIRHFAEKADLSEGVVRKYLRNDSYPTLDRLSRLAEAANVRAEWLLMGNGPMGRINKTHRKILATYFSYWKELKEDLESETIIQYFVAQYNQGIISAGSEEEIPEITTDDLLSLIQMDREEAPELQGKNENNVNIANSEQKYVNYELLKNIVFIVEDLLDQNSISINPENKGDLIATVYELYSDSDAVPDTAKVYRLLKLVS